MAEAEQAARSLVDREAVEATQDPHPSKMGITVPPLGLLRGLEIMHVKHLLVSGPQEVSWTDG